MEGAVKSTADESGEGEGGEDAADESGEGEGEEYQGEGEGAPPTYAAAEEAVGGGAPVALPYLLGERVEVWLAPGTRVGEALGVDSAPRN